jgi:hypothetical protein
MISRNASDLLGGMCPRVGNERWAAHLPPQIPQDLRLHALFLTPTGDLLAICRVFGLVAVQEEVLLRKRCKTTESAIARAKVKHTTGGIPRWSPTLVLVARFSAYVWQSGRDASFSLYT